jgi:hypothetical protein
MIECKVLLHKYYLEMINKLNTKLVVKDVLLLIRRSIINLIIISHY